MKVWKSGAYALTSRIVSIPLTMGSLAVLGRLISPEEFGVFGLAYAVFSVLRPFLDLGLTPAYLKLEKVDENVSNAFFTLNAVIGSAVGLLLMSSAYLIARFYEKPVLLYFIVLFAIAVLLQSLTCQPRASLVRNKCFDQLSFIRLSSLIIGVGSSITLAYLGYGYWALIFRVMLESLYQLILSIWFSKQSYRLVRLKAVTHFAGSLQFSSQILIGRLLAGMSSSFSDMAIGKALNPSAVGLYTRASALAIMPDANLRTALTTPALAYLSRLKGGVKISHYISLSWIIFLIAGIPCLLLIVLGDWLMPWVMGQQWTESGELLQWLGLWGVGKLYHGLGVIYHMDQKRMSRWISLVAWSIPLVYAVPLFQLFQYRNLSSFVASLAITYSLFWIAAYFHFLKKDLSGGSTCNMALIKQVGMASAFILSGLFFKDHLDFYGITSSSTVSSLKEISLVSLSSLSIATLYLVAFAKTELSQIKMWLSRT